MKILKKCLTCGAEFIASKMSNKYCCRECERDASRKREAKRKKSVRESEKEAALDKERDAVASRPFLTPSDVALLLDMSVSTVYRCFYSGIIKAVRIRRKTLVRREDLDKYFEDAGPYRKRSYKRKQEQEYYTLQENHDGRWSMYLPCSRCTGSAFVLRCLTINQAVWIRHDKGIDQSSIRQLSHVQGASETP